MTKSKLCSQDLTICELTVDTSHFTKPREVNGPQQSFSGGVPVAPHVLRRGNPHSSEAQPHTHHLHRTHTYSTSSGFLLCRPDLLRPCPTTTRQLHRHNGPVCKCEKLMSHHKNSVSPSWNFEQYLFSCSPRAAPHHPGTERFQKRRHSAADEMKGGGLSFTLFFHSFFFKIKCQ